MFWVEVIFLRIRRPPRYTRTDTRVPDTTLCRSAMKRDDGGDALVAVKAWTDTDDILRATAGGKCIRFSVSDVRVCAGRTSTGVRGIKLAQGAEGDDRVISMSILRSGDRKSVV